MFKRTLCAVLIALMLMMSTALAAGYIPARKLKPNDDLYVLDNVGVLSDDTKGEIVFSNDLLYKACGAQIAVVAIDTTGTESIDDYATELFNTWGIGGGSNNGFLLLMAIEDDDYYALCGDDLQPKFTSGTIKDYYDRYLETDFAAKRYDAGTKKFFEAVFARVADTYNADVTTAQGVAAFQAWVKAGNTATWMGKPAPTEYRQDDDFNFFGVVAVILLIVLIVVISSRSRRRRRMNTVYVAPPPPPPPMGGPGPGGYRGVNM
ncbi:MAG: TPM domain-containing protein, partial [Clostridia bacterium]|nr:TPM domain-containing protein [Clostridia bacterium]